MTRRLLVLLALLSLMACESSAPPTGVDDPTRPSLVLLDGTSTGNTHLFFLPPLVEEPTPTAPFDGTLRPRVEICEWIDGTTPCTGPPAFTFSMTSGTGGELLQVSLVDEHYNVHWDTQAEGADPGDIFRIRVFLASLELGSVDVEIGENGKDVKNINSGDNIGLVDNRTLPLKFRIEEGAVAEEEAQAEQECLDASGNVIDCDVVLVDADDGATATVDDDPGGTPTLASIVTIPPDDAFDAAGNPVSDFVLTLQHVTSEPAPPGDVPTEQQIPFFIEVTALDVAGNPVFFQTGATVVLCQPPDLSDSQTTPFIPDALHHFLTLFQVKSGVTEFLPTTLDNQANCPSGLHGGLNTVGIGSFSGFGAALPTDPASSTAVVPDGAVGQTTEIDIQAKLDASNDQIFGGDTVVVTVTGANPGTATVTDKQDGTYTATYTPTATGTDNITIEIRNVETGNLEPVSGSPFTSEVTSSPLPDLVVSSVGSVSLGSSTLSVPVTLSNLGGPAPEYPSNSTWDVAVYLSTDAVFDASDVHLTSMYSAWTYPVGTGWSASANPSGSLPTGTAPGLYHLIVVADAFPNQLPNEYPGVVESDETNNWTASTAFPVGLSGFGTATVDGVKGANEWDNADAVSVFTGANAGSVFYVMNDGTTLYLALEVVGDATLSTDDLMEVRFDNTLDGAETTGDDNLSYSTGDGFSDARYDGTNWGIADTSVDGSGAAGRSGSVNFFEMAHPLASGDPDDLSVAAGGSIGFCLRYFQDGSSSSSTQSYLPDCMLAVNAQSLYTPITIEPPPIP